MTKIIIFGGSFNPITYSHIGMVELASNIYKDSHLYWCLSTDHAFKSDLAPYDFRMRLIMKSVLDANIIPMGSYMWDFVTNLPYNPDDITILIGGDILDEIHLWKDWEKLVNTYHFTIIKRSKHKLKFDNLKKIKYNDIYDDENIVQTSSSEVRQLVKEGRSTHTMIPIQIMYEVEKYYDN